MLSACELASRHVPLRLSFVCRPYGCAQRFLQRQYLQPKAVGRQVGLDRNYLFCGGRRKQKTENWLADATPRTPPSGNDRAAHPAMNWFYWALASAFFAGLTAILAKIGVEGVDSNVATALRTTVVVCFAWTVAYFSGFATGASQLNGRAVLFLVLSGLATGASWLCYFRALQLGDASQVAPVDKLSIVFVLLFAARISRGENALADYPRCSPHRRRRGNPGPGGALGNFFPKNGRQRQQSFLPPRQFADVRNSCERATNR